MNDRNWTLRWGLVVIAVYALNAFVFVVSYRDYAYNLAHPIEFPKRSLIVETAFAGVMGLVLGQVGCVAIWFNVSDRNLIFKSLIFSLIVAQLAGVFAVVWQHTHNGIWGHWFFFAAIAVAILSLTGIALRLSSFRVFLISMDQQSVIRTQMGISIAQAILFTTMIAIAVAIAVTPRVPYGDDFLRPILNLIEIVAVAGILPIVGFLIGLSLRPLVMQFGACVAFSLIPAAIVAGSIYFSPQLLLVMASEFALILVLPTVWIQTARYLGYAFLSVELKAVVTSEHPLIQRDTAKEPSV